MTSCVLCRNEKSKYSIIIKRNQKYQNWFLLKRNPDDIIKEKLKDKDFVLGLKKFVINDIKNSPQTIGAGLDWAMNRDAYYEPRKANYLFEEMTKNRNENLSQIFFRLSKSHVFLNLFY